MKKIKKREFFCDCIVAMITPMNLKKEIDKFSLKKLIHFYILNGIKTILILGTTGESSTIKYNEYLDFVVTVKELSKNDLFVIVGNGSNSTENSIFLTELIEKSGIDACLSITPYYNLPTQDGLYQHFKSIAESTKLPQILYNIPFRTGVDLLPETVLRLSKIKNIIGIKEVSGDLLRINQIRKLIKNRDFIILSGNDFEIVDFIKFGGDGLISVSANIIPNLMKKVCHLALNGNIYQANQLNKNLLNLHKVLYIESNPIPIKWACYYLGLIKFNTLRLPLTSLIKKNQKIVKKEIKFILKKYKKQLI
ncbi:MAG: 4-hydroxy-tetrahydrodipicolinate synthase [Arsenophonus sp.]|nr:MAG: 4-hydroxy-tetrahydrodipicolinate synthase [Arsenophonus sp.]